MPRLEGGGDTDPASTSLDTMDPCEQQRQRVTPLIHLPGFLRSEGGIEKRDAGVETYFAHHCKKKKQQEHNDPSATCSNQHRDNK